jgi:hypothetical protein
MVRYAPCGPSAPDLLMIGTRNNPPLTGAYNGGNNGYVSFLMVPLYFSNHQEGFKMLEEVCFRWANLK